MADLLADAQERYREAIDATREQRDQIREDLAFTSPSDPQQWLPEEIRQREQDPGGARPCLTFDQLGQFVSNISGSVEQRPPALHAIPAGGGSSKRVAEQLDGFFRHVEHVSRAQQHYARALTSAARAGVGYLLVQPEFTDRALGYQEPRVGSEGDPLRVVFDPWSQETDGSDATFGHWLAPLGHREFERQFGAKASKISFGDEEQRRITDDRESVLVATEWRVETKTKNMIFAVDLDSQMPDDVFAVSEDDFWAQKQAGRNIQPATDSAGRQNYKDKTRCVYWARMSGAEILTEDREFPAGGIGIVPVYGYVEFTDGRMKYCGVGRRAREPQRAYNYHASEIRAYMASAPKMPWIAADESIDPYSALWDRASVDQRAWLPYKARAEDGTPLPPPVRPQVSINLQNNIQGQLQAREDIQAALGMYAANIGKQSNATSGVAYDAQKQQGEASTAHFPSHLAASLGQVGKLCMEMIPRLIDTRRQLRILNVDKSAGQIVADPKQTEPVVETEGGLSINPNVGRYDVRAVVGPSFSTQRQESREELREMMRANPAMTPAIAPLWAQTLDIPNSDKLAEVLTAVAPDAVKAILQPDKQESTAALKAENEQLKQALQEAIQHAHEAQQDADEAEGKGEDKHLDALVKARELEIKAYEAETKRLTAVPPITPEQVAAIAQQTVAQALQQPDPMGEPMSHESPGFPMGDAPSMPMDEQQPLQPEPIPQEMQEPPMPAGPSPDVQALVEMVGAMVQGQTVLAQSLMRLGDAMASPRKRVPVRDKGGNILHVIDGPADEQQEQQ